MRGHALAATAFFVGVSASSLATSAAAADLIGQVENPFRFFKSTRSFALHEAAFNAVRGSGALPADIVWRIERKLNDNCYDVNGRPRRYLPVCERRFPWGAAKEDYILPDAHTVNVGIPPAQLAGA